MKVLVDTVIVFDFLGIDEGHEQHCEAAAQLFQLIATGAIEGCLAASQMTDIYYGLLASYGPAKHGRPEADARETMADIIESFTVIDTWGKHCRSALFAVAPDYRNALQIESAEAAQCDAIITRDEALLRTETSIRTCTAEEFLASVGVPIEG